MTMTLPPPRQERAQRRAPGYTLVELLIVVAIVSALVALLLPALQFARGRARQAACVSRMRQIGVAHRMYMEDHHDVRPPYLHSLHPAYVTDRRLFVCPADAWEGEGGWAWAAWGQGSTPPQRWPFPVSYGYFFPPVVEDPLWGQAEAAPGRPGYLVCVLHGRFGDGPHPGAAPLRTSGTVLRLCFDGSVIARTLPDPPHFHAWELMTDRKGFPEGP